MAVSSSSSSTTFAGLSTGIQTDALISAIINQAGRQVQAMQDRTAANDARTTALKAIKTSMSDLTISMAQLGDQFNARSVTSSDSNNTYVTASASSTVPGNYDLNVQSVATRGRISSTMVSGSPTNLAVADASATIFDAGTALAPKTASFAVQGTDGVVKTFQLNNNSLNGLRDAINNSGAGVTASIVNTGAGATPYQLVVTAKDTGTGSTGGVVSLAVIANQDGSASNVNPSLGIAAGVVNPDGLGAQGADAFSNPTTMTGGLQSAAAKDAVFTLNDIQMTRKSNTVTDAVEGMTLTLKAGGQTGNTTLTVVQNTTIPMTGMQDVVSKFNKLFNTYRTARNPSTDPNTGITLPGALVNDSGAASLISRVRAALTGAMDGTDGSTVYKQASSLGLKTMVDGTLFLDTTDFQAGLTKDPAASRRLLMGYSGDTTNGAVQVTDGQANSPTGTVTFTINSFTQGGAVSGTFSGIDAKGVAFSNVTLSGSNGVISAPLGSPLEGLTLAVTGTGSGSLHLTRGLVGKVQDTIANITGATGAITTLLKSIESQNKSLSNQIDAGQAALDKRKATLQLQYARMETLVGQMKASGGTVSGLM